METDPKALPRLIRLRQALGLENGLDNILEDEFFPNTSNQEPAQKEAHGDLSNVQDGKIKLRKLIAENGSWGDIQSLLWKIFHLGKSPELAAQIVETAFLYASLDQTLSVVAKLKNSKVDFFRSVHPQLRFQFLLELVKVKKESIYLEFMWGQFDSEWLIPEEKLFILSMMAKNPQSSTLYHFFKKNEQALIDVSIRVGHHLQLAPASLYFLIANHALLLGLTDVGAYYLRKIQPKDAEYSEGMRLLLSSGAQTDFLDHTDLVQRLMRDESWQGRLKIIQNEFAKVETNDKAKLALNALLDDPLKWFVKTPESWGGLSDLLISQNATESQLPNLFSVFRKNILVFHDPSLDGALWLGFVKNCPNDELLYYKGCAYLHCYLSSTDPDEEVLWQGRTLIQDYPLGQLPTWKSIHKFAFESAQKSAFESRKGRVLLQIRAAAADLDLSVKDIADYFASDDAKPPLSDLRRLRAYARRVEASDLEARLILAQSKRSAFCNDDLTRLLFLSARIEQHDLAWRVASVLQARRSLPEIWEHPWQVSGEKRKTYEFLQPNAQELDACLVGFTPEQSRLAWAFLQVGSAVPELLSLVDEKIKPLFLPELKEDSPHYEVDKFLKTFKWLRLKKDFFAFAKDKLPTTPEIPNFCNSLPENDWSYLLITLCQFMGFNAWGLSLGTLKDLVEKLVPRFGTRYELRRNSEKASKWLRSLDSDQKAAWHDITVLIRKLDPEVSRRALILFVCRLSTLIFQNHYQALTSMQEMQLDLPIIRSMEHWIVSPAYTKARKNMMSQSRVPIPLSLKLMQSEPVI